MVKIVQKKSGLVLGKKPGFSFLEIAVVLLIIGLISAVAVPALFRKEPKQQRQLFAQKINGLLEQASSQALLTGVIQKVALDTAKKEFIVTPEQSKEKTSEDEAVKTVARLPWPENLEVEQFFIQGVDEFSAKNSGKRTDEVWFYIVPDAMAQEVIINGRDSADMRSSGEQAQWSLIINPFTLRCKLYEEFQSPSW